MAGAALTQDREQQLGLYGGRRRFNDGRARRSDQPEQPPVCTGCRSSEARYGFRDAERDDPLTERPRTLCFECFRMELTHRQAIAARLARGWNAAQVSLPLEETLETLDRRRRRAQIAARRALELR